MTDHTPAHNPDHYRKWTRVVPSLEAKRQAIGGRAGVVISRYPHEQIVTVKWDDKKSTERWHVNLLDREQNNAAAIRKLKDEK